MQKSYAHNTAYPVLVPMSPNVGRTGRLANALHKYKAWEHRHWQGSGPKHQPRAMACYRRTMIQRVVRCEHRTMVWDIARRCKRRTMVRSIARRSHRAMACTSCDAHVVRRPAHCTTAASHEEDARRTTRALHDAPLRCTSEASYDV